MSLTLGLAVPDPHYLPIETYRGVHSEQVGIYISLAFKIMLIHCPSNHLSLPGLTWIQRRTPISKNKGSRSPHPFAKTRVIDEFMTSAKPFTRALNSKI